MNLCDNNHDEVVYTAKHCPVCEAYTQIKELEAEIGELVKEMEAIDE